MTPAYDIDLDIDLTESVTLRVTGAHFIRCRDGFCDGWRYGPRYELVTRAVRSDVDEVVALALLSDLETGPATARECVDEMALEQAGAKDRDRREAA